MEPKQELGTRNEAEIEVELLGNMAINNTQKQTWHSAKPYKTFLHDLNLHSSRRPTLDCDRKETTYYQLFTKSVLF